ncbi:hypothetical protein PFBG_00624 [Plasmodium falciparum 7G8]|nr:hypothetical protein PFBG_00624 [Plasmodium falciparum 7G8]
MNIHKYESFSIIIQIHHLNLKFGDDDNAKFIVHLKIGNRYAYTHYHKQYQNKVHIEERKNMVVKQNNNTLRLEVYKKGTLKNTFFGSAEIHIYSEIVKKLFPCNVYFNITNKNQIVGTACLSFHYINLDCIKKDDQIYTSLFIETIISVQKNQTKNNEKIEKLIDEGKEHFEAIKETDLSTNTHNILYLGSCLLASVCTLCICRNRELFPHISENKPIAIYKNISNLVLEDKIRLFCKNLNGYLLHSNFYIKRFYNKYYFYLHFFKGKFYWCYYNEEADAKMDKNRVGYVRLEYVANVYSDVYSHKYFYIKYRKKNERKENYLYLKTIDKDRNIWVNIIHDFIILVSNYKRERKNKKYKIKEFKDNLIEDTPKEILEINKTLSRSLSNNSMKNKYLDKKKKVEVLSDMDNEENYMNSGDLGPVFKDMSKNMYNYSD